MSKYHHDEYAVTFGMHEDSSTVSSHRSLDITDSTLASLDSLREELGTLFSGLNFAQVMEMEFDLEFKGPTKSPRFSLHIEIDGDRKATKKERERHKKEESLDLDKAQKASLALLRSIKKSDPNLFNLL